MFSQKWREVLIKAVALALPKYTMSLFRIPDALCSDLESMMAHFWWTGDLENRKIHYKSWALLCLPKVEGGMGFMEVRGFNQALIVKQGWRIQQRSDTLVAKVLRGKYFPNSSFLNAPLGSYPSYLWRSLGWGNEVIQRDPAGRLGIGKIPEFFLMLGCQTCLLSKR